MNLPNKEVTTLLKVRDNLCSGAIKHVPYDDKGDGFNMGWVHHKNDCGTTHCIAGFCLDYDMTFNIGRQEYRNLFIPPFMDSPDWREITACQAVQAIDNFLEDGDPKWSEVMK